MIKIKEKRRKRILLIGGLGEIGKILSDKLIDSYEISTADVHKDPQKNDIKYFKLDIANFSELIKTIPSQIDVIINLAGMAEQTGLVDEKIMSKMNDIYIKGAYNLFLAASKIGIPKVIFVSSNHVTDYYENMGKSILGHEISINDYPLSKSIYGSLKLAGESIGHVFSIHKGLSVICLRIGTVRINEKEALINNKRIKKTLLSKTDLVNLIKCSIEAPINFGIYYGVSDNPGKPWSTENAFLELGFKSTVNSNDILK